VSATKTRPRRPAEAGAARRPVDASMDLLNQILREPVDPDYARVAATVPRPDGRPRRAHWWLALVLVLAGTLFAVGALQTNRTRPVQTTERAELIERIGTAEGEQDDLRRQVEDLDAQIDELRSTALGTDGASKALEAEIDRLGPGVGLAPVTGPGVVVVVDDAPTTDGDARDQVLDLDLQVLANGLWTAGAEAVSINGHRLSGLTAIRGAGDAITVDYRSLTRPYRVEAIGDPRTLQARLAESAAGAWWNDLAQNRDMTYQTSDASRLVLASDPGITLRYARTVTR
jgi:uncharacterized protein YlxW (UPF0749 family)